ncbi:MAG: transketolase [Candidatus Hydromicrobium americanum]|nr:MAG: transketolase [Candidatus Hydromicrobium americanum]
MNINITNDNNKVNDLEYKSILARKKIIEITTRCESGHLGGSLSCIDILIALYFKILKHNPLDPDWELRDRFVLSKGHAAPALYVVLSMCGYFPEEELSTFRKLNSRLQGHPDSKKLPGIEISTGSLGLGFSAAVGMALGYKYDGIKSHIFCLLGDGECDEGQVWEAAMFASHNKLENITAIIDRNGFQIDGKTENIMKLEPLADKWKSFGWLVKEINGHDIDQIINSLEQSRRSRSAIIANTVKGKGVSFLENNNKYHSKPCNNNECEIALEELDKKLSVIKKNKKNFKKNYEFY